MSIYEEGTISVAVPIKELFGNLAIFDLKVKWNSPGSIVPGLGNRGSRSAERRDQTFESRRLHGGRETYAC